MPHEGNYTVVTFSHYSCPKLAGGLACSNFLHLMLVHEHPDSGALPFMLLTICSVVDSAQRSSVWLTNWLPLWGRYYSDTNNGLNNSEFTQPQNKISLEVKLS